MPFSLSVDELELDPRAVQIVVKDILNGKLSHAGNKPLSVVRGRVGFRVGDGYHRLIQGLLSGVRKFKVVIDHRYETEFVGAQTWTPDLEDQSLGLTSLGFSANDVMKARDRVTTDRNFQQNTNSRPDMTRAPKNSLTPILAHHLSRQDKVEQWASAIPHYLTVASPDMLEINAGMEQGSGGGDGVHTQQPPSDRLSILVDGDSQKMVTQLYQDYVSENNFVLFIEFVKGMDRFIQNFRKLAQSREIAQQVPQEEDEDAEIGGGRSRGRSRGRRRAPGKPQPALDAAPQPNPEELQADDAPSATVASGPATKALAAFFGSHIAGQ